MFHCISLLSYRQRGGLRSHEVVLFLGSLLLIHIKAVKVREYLSTLSQSELQSHFGFPALLCLSIKSMPVSMLTLVGGGRNSIGLETKCSSLIKEPKYIRLYVMSSTKLPPTICFVA